MAVYERWSMILQVTNKKKISLIVKDFRNNSPFLFMLLPGTLLLLAFNYIPMFGLMIAFIDYKYVGKNAIDNFLSSKFVGFKNFEFFLNSPDAFIITRNTLAYNFAFIILGISLAAICAIILNEIGKSTASKYYQSFMLLPYFFSWVVVGYIVLAFLSSDYGIVNKLIKQFGGEPVSWYSTSGAWPPIIILLHLWKNVGYNTVIFIAAIAGISQELYEAATTDGASKLQKIIHITLPGLKPLVIILAILNLGNIFNADFGLFYQATSQMGGGFLKSSLNVIDVYVYDSLVNTGDVGMAAAAGFYKAVVGFITVLTANLIIRKIDKENALF
jgi:putative aldouronate transport system permease protein